MFQIFDCNGRPVGRPEGYEKHSTAQGLVERAGRIKKAIWTAYHLAPWPESGRKLVYSIRWAAPIDSNILATETAVDCFRDAAPMAPIRDAVDRIASGAV